jgi:hypothetical protein
MTPIQRIHQVLGSLDLPFEAIVRLQEHFLALLDLGDSF